MENALLEAFIYVVRTAFDFFIYIFMLRFLFQLVRADYYNPVIQLIVKLSDPLIRPLRAVVPSVGAVDMASIVALFILAMLEHGIFVWMSGMPGNVVGLFVWSFGALLGVALNVYFFSIIIQAVMSWFPGASLHIAGLLHLLNEPLLGRARRLLPSVSGIDLSPLVALVVLQLVNIVLVGPVAQAGMRLL